LFNGLFGTFVFSERYWPLQKTAVALAFYGGSNFDYFLWPSSLDCLSLALQFGIYEFIT